MSERWPGGLINQTAPVPSGPYQDSTAYGVWTLDQVAYLKQQGLWPTPGNINPSAFIENLFSTYLYTGNGTSQTINNGLDLAGNGGMAWIKSRTSAEYHNIFDTVRGAASVLFSNVTDAAGNSPTRLTSFNSNGFTVGTNSGTNGSGTNYASWTFREQPKFFDIVTYTGNGSGSGRTISHNLGSAPGMIILKVTNLAGDDWYVYHRSIPTRVLALNSTAITDPSPAQYVFGNGTTVVAPTSTNFTIGSTVNPNGYTFVAYLFAHDAGGFGATGTDNVISCGSFTTDSSGNATVNLGYEPQYILCKYSSSASNWYVFDTMRGLSLTGQRGLFPNQTYAESGYSGTGLFPTATGFSTLGTSLFDPNVTLIYMAIRRPMAVPTDATTVHQPAIQTAGTNYDITFTGMQYIDTVISFKDVTPGGIYNAPIWNDRLRGFPIDMSGSTYTGNPGLASSTTGAEATGSSPATSNYLSGVTMNRAVWGGGWNGYNGVFYGLKRAAGFFDEVCYTGTGANQNITHNLGVAPELIICKIRSGSSANWVVWNTTLNSSTGYLYLNADIAASNFAGVWNGAPTSTYFTLGTNYQNNESGSTLVAYLFATCPGVSKVGSYTGTSSNQTINCGFTGGARFVLIKRTDSTGDWYVWNTASGMVSGNDKRLKINSNTAQVAADWVVTTTGGFQIVTPDAGVNYSGGSYIFLAIA